MRYSTTTYMHLRNATESDIEASIFSLEAFQGFAMTRDDTFSDPEITRKYTGTRTGSDGHNVEVYVWGEIT
jgi:hypothetical protein